ncbi:DUF2793 domain-containing protein [Methylobacterium haplocladii]|uniref:DUF2793 domain-containing protein n=1 Tax=Methylobacterium haplocladii TaxID=1176176 RepID=A0A512IKV4_9HYPH|nr:DUF2793 domain-containing protein [Methylobacterium haplocladii]GEO98314.1 hypothetical protein MHA02_07020 [Methylobacterium haplocladii]GJD82942.1 hypothetical protein HPGCJGGD_0804 [Methylobacterium haplocladii]GLS61515.1 hypothetical protein GCM10007887_42300 [Methylobacterium haplocladii]
MADTTRNLGLPLLAAAQAQKHVTHNEALAALDALVQLACLDKDLAAPPVNPMDGDRYLVTVPSPTGAWAGLSGQVVRFADGVWVGAVPRPGWFAYVIDEADLYVFTGTAWASFRGSLTALQNLTRLGIGTAADATNRFALKSDAALLSWDDVTPGSGNLRVTLNKQASARDAALTVQTGFSTRALFGTLGSDDFALKVSPDGAAFFTPLTASAATGRLTLGRIAGPLEISANAGALPDSLSQTVLRVSGADGLQARLVFDGFGSNTPGNFIFRAAAGTAAMPTALQTGATIGQFSAFGYGATAYGGAARAQVAFVATEAWTDSAQGARVVFRTTPTGAAGIVEVFSAESNGSIRLLPMASDPTVGVGQGQLYANSTAAALKWHTGTAWARISNFAKFASSTSFDNYVAAATWTKVQFNTADSNDQGAFIAASNRFVAPEASLYGFDTALVFKKNGSNAPTALEVQFYRNGAPAGRGRASATGILVDGVTAIDLSTALKLAAGDTVEVFVRFSGADGYVAASDSLFGGRQMA